MRHGSMCHIRALAIDAAVKMAASRWRRVGRSAVSSYAVVHCMLLFIVVFSCDSFFRAGCADAV